MSGWKSVSWWTCDEALAVIRCLDAYAAHQGRSPALGRELWLTVLLAARSLNEQTGRAL